MGTLLEWFRFLSVGWKDLFEILLVAYLIYRILVLWTGTRAFQILFGLVLLVAVYALAQLLELDLITYILSQVFTYGVFVLIVVFQPELRSALARLGQSRLWRILPRVQRVDVVEEITTAAERLSRAKIGAIIAIERDVGLGEYAETGTPISAQVSADLLTTIFTPYSPLHDGAAIIRGDQIVAAGCILPLTQFPISDKTLGTRHRAAIGLSEETDAYVVVVSEETSLISLAHRGVLRRGLELERLRARLAAERDVPGEPREERRPVEAPAETLPAAGEETLAAPLGAEVADPPREGADGAPRAVAERLD
ncbi:MAG: diadenylate cyclase CdaA [Gemmatimonadota bacterium]